MKLSVATVPAATCDPARLTFKLITRAKYCKTASLDSGLALTNLSKIRKSEFYTTRVIPGKDNGAGDLLANSSTFLLGCQ